MTEGSPTSEELLAQIASLKADLEIARHDLTSFNYSVTHDLRAPLRAIDAFSQALAEDCSESLGEQGLDYLKRIRSSAAFMEELLNSLLELSRVSRVELRREPVNLSEIAESIAHDLKRMNPARNVDFVFQRELTVEGDPALLKICLQHLIGNAFKFTSRRPAARIEMGSDARDGRRRFFVRDNGAGFNQDYAGKMFGAFQRLHSQSDFEGIGIGLAVVERIVHRHGGQVSAEGKPEEGATVLVELP